jgi:threonine/homoserine/homoserine lactone efflux protein
MNAHQFILFAFACLMLNITPGNDMLYVISRSTALGVKAGILSALGIMTGCFIHILAAIAGLAALIRAFPLAFALIRYAGAGYLIYLGMRYLFQKSTGIRVRNLGEHRSPGRTIYLQGLLTNLLNPKVALFILAFIPQFVSAGSLHPQWQILWLGLWFNFSGTMVNLGVGLLFGKMSGLIAKSEKFARVQSRLSGILLAGLGIRVALGPGIS